MYKILPYPQEILRFISTGLNVRNNNKKLDNAIREEKIITEDDIESYYNISIVDEIKSLSIDFSYFVKISLKELFITYFNVVREISFLPLNDDQKIDALYITFNRVLESLFYSVNKKYKFNIKKIFNSSNEIETAILHIENKYLWFKNFSASLQKEEKDLIWRWKKGKNNPTLAKVKALREKSENKKSQDWDEIIAIILLSRLIKSLNDRFRSSDFSKFSKSLSISQDVVYILQQFEETDNIFNKKQTNETRLILEDFISKTIKSDNLGVKFFNYWAKARINLINCDLKKACLDYKLAFEIAKYNAGEVFIQFCHEALLVANLSSSEEPLYKRIYDFLIIMKEKTSIGKKYEYKWEKESSIIEFKNKFPYIKITKEIKDKINIASGEIKVDLRYPNKKINNNLVTRVKRQPQIFHFINNNDVNSVKLILDHEDFDVNKLSDSNDSALLLSLGLMSVVNFNDPNNDEIFKLISKKEHKKETMNKMTSKRMYTPLMFAIDTGRFDVVKRIVEMGADVNLHAETDLTSPLYKVIINILNIKNVEKIKREAESIVFHENSIESIRRYYPQWASKTNEEIKNLTKNQKEITKKIREIEFNNRKEKFNLSELYKIANFLIESGANVNSEQLVPIKGYTPLMLCAESNEIELFEKMMESGGDFKKGYFYRNREVKIPEIASYFKSNLILDYINKNNL